MNEELYYRIYAERIVYSDYAEGENYSQEYIKYCSEEEYESALVSLQEDGYRIMKVNAYDKPNWLLSQIEYYLELLNNSGRNADISDVYYYRKVISRHTFDLLACFSQLTIPLEALHIMKEEMLLVS